MKKQQIRIIGGRWRSRRIQFLGGPGLRPTGDRNRETLFNWLSPYLHQAHCLDLFGGSGALTFEALSRGAASATVLEKSKRVATQIKTNASQLGAEHITIRNQDTLAWLKNQSLKNHDKEQQANQQPEPTKTFNICFIDPPFNKALVEKSVTLLEQTELLSKDALIYIEHEQGLSLSPPEHWETIREKQAGQVEYRLFQSMKNRSTSKQQ